MEFTKKMADSKKDIYCPACDKVMKKIFVSSADFNVDVCLDGCGGIFFDNREFRKFDQDGFDPKELLKVLKGQKFKAADQSEERFCPACGVKMIKNISPKNCIEVDDCYTCGGKFLDGSEFVQVLEERADREGYMEFLMGIINSKPIE